MHVLVSYKKDCVLTNDDKTIFAPSDAHIDLMLISDEAKMLTQPLVVCLHKVWILDLFKRQ